MLLRALLIASASCGMSGISLTGLLGVFLPHLEHDLVCFVSACYQDAEMYKELLYPKTLSYSWLWTGRKNERNAQGQSHLPFGLF